MSKIRLWVLVDLCATLMNYGLLGTPFLKSLSNNIGGVSTESVAGCIEELQALEIM